MVIPKYVENKFSYHFEVSNPNYPCPHIEESEIVLQRRNDPLSQYTLNEKGRPNVV